MLALSCALNLELDLPVPSRHCNDTPLALFEARQKLVKSFVYGDRPGGEYLRVRKRWRARANSNSVGQISIMSIRYELQRARPSDFREDFTCS
jgi:hypothetical protein